MKFELCISMPSYAFEFGVVHGQVASLVVGVMLVTGGLMMTESFCWSSWGLERLRETTCDER